MTLDATDATPDATPLEPEMLLAHARKVAGEDEARHYTATTVPRPSQHNERTIRGWGSAALNDLEWASNCIYPKGQRETFCGVYAAEYIRCRAARTRA
jgi:hypothetical protein